MPGFAKPEPNTNQVIGNADFFNINDVGDQTFYGFKYNPLTAKLTVEEINDGSPVVLPTSESLNPNDYKQWVWTKRNLSFQWNSANKSHLLTEVR
jgi:hypothetical protein